MIRKTLLVLLCLVAMGAVSVLALSQEKKNVVVTIEITDKTTARVFEAQIKIRPHGGAMPRTPDTSNKAGQFTLNLQPGSYDLFVASPGLESWAKTIQVTDAPSQKFDVRLEVPAGRTTTVYAGMGWEQVPPPPPVTVTIQVRDQTGAGVPQARIHIWSILYSKLFKKQTDEDGKVAVDILPSDLSYDCEMEVTSPGFRSQMQRFKIEKATKQTVSVVLEPMPI